MSPGDIVKPAQSNVLLEPSVAGIVAAAVAAVVFVVFVGAGGKQTQTCNYSCCFQNVSSYFIRSSVFLFVPQFLLLLVLLLLLLLLLF